MWALPKYLLTPPPPYPRPLCQTDTRRHLFARRRTFYEGWQKALLKKGLPLEVNILEDNPVTEEELTFVKSLSKTQTNVSQDEEN